MLWSARLIASRSRNAACFNTVSSTLQGHFFPAGEKVRPATFNSIEGDTMKHTTDAPEQDDSFGPVVYQYTRAQALADGILVDVSLLAREAGFTLPVAITQGAWHDCVAWSEQDSGNQLYQDESGRLWDVLWMAVNVIRSATGCGNRLLFSLCRVPRDGKSTKATAVTLKLIIGPGDQGEPVMTILLPEED